MPFSINQEVKKRVASCRCDHGDGIGICRGCCEIILDQMARDVRRECAAVACEREGVRGLVGLCRIIAYNTDAPTKDERKILRELLEEDFSDVK